MEHKGPTGYYHNPVGCSVSHVVGNRPGFHIYRSSLNYFEPTGCHIIPVGFINIHNCVFGNWPVFMKYQSGCPYSFCPSYKQMTTRPVLIQTCFPRGGCTFLVVMCTFILYVILSPLHLLHSFFLNNPTILLKPPPPPCFSPMLCMYPNEVSM